jgi:hypothetical protein
MMKRLATLALLAMSAVAPLAAHAQAVTLKPHFTSLPPHTVQGVQFAPAQAGATLAQWNGSFVDHTGATVSYTMAGLDPAVSNATTTVQVYIVPVKMVYGSTNGNMTFDPKVHTVSNGKTVIQNIVDSPLFQSNTNFTTGGTDLGTTQYIDAFQRGNFWNSVSTNTGYHTLLKATVLPEMTINVSARAGKVVQNYFTPGFRGLMDINVFDSKIQGYMSKLKKIQPNVLPLFITTDVFLTSGGGCCIGGYHSATAAQPGGQTYAHASYIDSVGSFAQDVSAISHELGEWIDDPFVDNRVNCVDNANGYLENGDILENFPNYGGWPYTAGGFTYNLQSLSYMPYWGAPSNTSVHGWYSFQGEQTTVCPGQ